MAKKVTLNSAYGALGNAHFRFYNTDLAEAITLSGQLSIQWIGNRLNELLNTVSHTKNEDYIIASDTDSVYLKIENSNGQILTNLYCDDIFIIRLNN